MVLRRIKVARWRANKHIQRQQSQWQPHKMRLLKRCQTIWFNLGSAQKLYLLAILCLVVLQSGWLATVITIIALVVEFWPKFNQLWHSLAGKALILVFYATIANFVLASASGIVNEVTGVSASHFNYTHNFATLLYLPPWALGITLCTLLLLQLFLPFYIVALLLIKPFGSQRIKFISQSYSPLMTALVRFFLASVVIVNIISFVDDKPAEAVLDDITASFSEGKALVDESPARQEQAVQQLSEKIQQDLPTQHSGAKQSDNSAEVQVEGDTEAAKNIQQFLHTKGYFERSKRLIAMFAYSYEADSFSRCKKANSVKAVELNDYEIVEIAPDDSMPYGYRFRVRACQSPGISPP
ncbi:hypothetical protein [Pseudoalteromonas ruthenica]|uniref:hypothetical protein n=1 Tax=Pseudoalteromonas ruthenica TaxID=151081 RepID=UPI000AAEF3AA|nr:hypothetical protein [Pseudoalteromonas ruthenica]